jgi:S1-C subfamily serine protease
MSGWTTGFERCRSAGRAVGVWLHVTSGLERGRAVEVGDEAVTIGSGPGCALVLLDPDVAPLHASVRCKSDGSCELVPLTEDLTTVGGKAVEGTTPLTEGARLTIGDVALELRATAPDDPDAPLDEDLAEALGSDGPHADDELTPVRERRRVTRATALAIGALGLAAVVGLLVVTGVIGGGGGEDVDVAEIVKTASPSTVRVLAREGSSEGSGTGWVLDAKEGLIVTNFHVVNAGNEVSVAVDGAEREGKLIGAAPCDDLAVVQLEERDGLETLPIAEPDTIDQGEQVIAVGFAAGAGDEDKLTSTTGVVSVASQPLKSPSPDTPDFPDMIQTDAAINPGNSGGPLLDAENRLVGVNTAVLLERGGVPLQNIGYAIGVQRVQEVVGDLRRRRSESWLGTGLSVLPEEERRRNNLPRGVVAISAYEGTPAAKAGLTGRQVIVTSVDGERLLGTMADYCRKTDGKRSGDRVQLEVVDREGKRRRVPLELG